MKALCTTLLALPLLSFSAPPEAWAPPLPPAVPAMAPRFSLLPPLPPAWPESVPPARPGAPAPAAPRYRTIRAKVTAYTDHDPADIAAGYGRQVTATGTNTRIDRVGVAADPRALPFGTQVSIPGYRDGAWVAVDDTGGALRRSWRRGVTHLDVRFSDRRTALRWGVKWIDVRVRVD